MDALPADTKAYFIKLGEHGEWEPKCLDEGTIYFGYREVPFELCASRDWDEVHALRLAQEKAPSTATSDTRQIRIFFEATPADVFITFYRGFLWWCHPAGTPVELSPGGVRMRPTVSEWKKTSLRGKPLLMSSLSGKLNRTQQYRQTICEVKERAYLLRRINDQPTAEVAAAEVTERLLIEQILAMVRLLTWEDFELLVELIFSQSGWQRLARTGGAEKTVDLELRLPTTQERAFVQVKSDTDTQTFDRYAQEFIGSGAHHRMFYVWHTGTIERTPPASITMWSPDVIGSRVLEAGLLGWLKERVS